MNALPEPVPFEVYEAGVYLHGTKAELAVGDLLVPGRESNFETGRVMNYVYFSATLDAAAWGAELAGGEGRRRIYVVDATGAVEGGARHGDYQDRSPARRRLRHGGRPAQ